MLKEIQGTCGSRWTCLVLIPIAISLFLVYQIATKSGYNVHPDEYAHLDAICYYETHWWPPGLNSNGIIYSGYGWSRLYDGELVYLVFGKLIQLEDTLKRMWSQAGENATSRISLGESMNGTIPREKTANCGNIIATFPKYRPLNVWLYLLTLLILVVVGRKHLWPLLIALLLLSLPQVNYIYSYANSDAWGLSMSIFLFIFVVARRKSILKSWTALLVLSILTALVILSKKTFWLSIPYAYLLLAVELFDEWKVRGSIVVKKTSVRLPLLLLLTLLWVAPLKIIYPLSQGNFEAGAIAMREARAIPEYKPSHPTQIGFHMAERGFPIWSAANMLWFKQSAASFYGLFGYMSERLPQWLYTLVYGLLFILAAITYSTLGLRWRELPVIDRSMLLTAPIMVLLVTWASLYNSWTFDFQPQGRYLFAALIPLALVEGGLLCYETRRIQAIRLVTWAVLYIICLIVLMVSVLGNPELIP